MDSIHFSTGDNNASLPTDYTFTADDSGVHTFDFTFSTVGTQTITVTDTVAPIITGAQSGIVVHNGATLIPLTTRKDLVADPVRNILYITTSTGTIERYDLATQTFLSPLLVGPLMLSRFDLWPAALTAVALAALTREHDRTGAAKTCLTD